MLYTKKRIVKIMATPATCTKEPPSERDLLESQPPMGSLVPMRRDSHTQNSPIVDLDWFMHFINMKDDLKAMSIAEGRGWHDLASIARDLNLTEIELSTHRALRMTRQAMDGNPPLRNCRVRNQ